MIGGEFLFTESGQKWNTIEITLPERISDGMIEDLDKDGYKDLLLIAGNFINIFFYKRSGFPSTPDYRFYYTRLGEYIDVGDVDPSSPGLELLGLSKDGVKFIRRNKFGYVDNAEFLISTKIDMPEFHLGPFIADFAFDINADGKDEIFLLRDGKAFFYRSNNSSQWLPLEIENPINFTTVYMGKKSRANSDLVIHPLVESQSSLLVQDFNGDGLLDFTSITLRKQKGEFRFQSLDSPLKPKATLNKEKRPFYLDVDNDGNLDLIFLEVHEIYAENMSPFPIAKFIVHLRKSNEFSLQPNHVFKTIIVNGQSPFIDVDGDGDLDFISVWSEITPGSKENILQFLLESTLIFYFRCYLYDQTKGYSIMPDIGIKSKIKLNFSYLSNALPFDISADVNGDGIKDLIIFKDSKNALLYFLDFKAKNKIKSVELIEIPKGFRGYQFCDLNGNGKKELIYIKERSIQILAFTNK